jgi:pilus assembly protein CpaE
MDQTTDRLKESHVDVRKNEHEELGLGRVRDMIKDFSDEGIPAVNPIVVLVSPNETSLTAVRRAMEAQRATIAKEFKGYPTYAHLEALLELDFDAIVVEIDTDIELALEIVEALCARKPLATAMVYSHSGDTEKMVRSMRAGAREYLTGTSPKAMLHDALLRAAARRLEQTVKKTSGKCAVFWGTKGGSGVTTLATNFAIALRSEVESEVALLDLNPQLGDVAVLLGMTPSYTVADALNNARRLDQHFISTLVAPHRSGIAVLAAPDVYTPSVPIDGRTIGRLVDVARSRYSHVVIDAGRELGPGAETLLQMADVIYLVTQLDVVSLRNTQRFISYIKALGGQRVELVVNRFEPRKTEFDDERITKVLGIPPKWKVPNDYLGVRRSSNEGRPLALEKSAAANAIRAMARAASGKQVAPEKRRGLGLFGM